MGALMRAYDWSKNILGSPNGWPQSLKTTLSIILNTKFPMFLFWGSEAICFYNDAYRPSLGNNGKHPQALGKPGKEVWPEIWYSIGPQISQVMGGGEASWNENQLLPIFRNGKMEDVYWTFSYSPVKDESGKPAGVFVACSETTQTVTSLQSLADSKIELEFAIEAAELGTYDYNPITNKFSANERLMEWFGLPPKSQIELSYAIDAIAPADRDAVTAAIQGSLSYASGGRYDIQYTIVHPVTGVERIVHAKGKASFDEHQVAYRMNGTLQDITEQVKVQRSLMENERRLRLIILQAPVAIGIFTGANYVVEIVNGKALELWGRSFSDVNGKPILEAMPELEGQGIRDLLDAVYNTGVPFVANERPVTLYRAGKLVTVYVNFEYDPLYDANGEVVGILAVATDVTEQVQSRKRVEESEERVRAIVNNAPFPIGVYVGREMRIQLANQSIIDVWGKGPDVIGKLYSEILPELGNQQIFNQLEEAFQTGVSFNAKNQYLDIVEDGKIRPYYFNYTFTPLFDASGAVYAVMNTAADVTELNLAKQRVDLFAQELEAQVKERTRELEKKNSDLQSMNSELESFAYVASHDLQEPLRKIQIFSDRLMESELPNLSEQGKNFFDRIAFSVERMRSLINDLLTYSRTNRRDEEFVDTDLSGILSEVLEEMKETIQAKNARVVVEGLGVARVIPFQFAQLFQNLISNSLKFSHADRAPEIRIAARKIGGSELSAPFVKQGGRVWRIDFSDNGIGFDAANGERIFQVFQRLNAVASYPGTGVGLAIVKKIVENHQGQIFANGVAGEGARFAIVLPAPSA